MHHCSAKQEVTTGNRTTHQLHSLHSARLHHSPYEYHYTKVTKHTLTFVVVCLSLLK